MAVAKRISGKYSPDPVGTLKLMSKTVRDAEYKLHGKDTPIYMYFFLRDDAGNNFGISSDNNLVRPEEMDEWERNLIV